MALHKIIEAGGDVYFPFAKSKIAQLVEQADGGDASKTWVTNTGHVISVRVCGDEHYIRVKGAGVSYEFFTSDHIGYDRFGELQDQYPGDLRWWQHSYSMGTPGNATTEEGLPGEPTYLPHVAGHFTRAIFGGKNKILPIYSHTLTAPPQEVGETAPKWVTLPTTFVEGSPAPAGMKPILTPYVWQLQRFKEAVWWPSSGVSSIVMSTQAQAPGRSNTCNLHSAQTGRPTYSYYSTTYGGLVETPDPAYLVDHGYDVMPTYLSNGLTISKGPSYLEPGVWWRRSAVARSDRGNLFFICTDNIGRFQVYRALTAAEAASGATVVRRALARGEYRQYTPPYPAWVTVPGQPENIAVPGGDAAFKDHCWMWAFNQDGTRAAAIAFNSVDSPHYVVKAGGYGGGLVGDQYNEHSADPINGVTPARDDAPGLVEFGIAIVEGHGEAPGDLNFSVTFSLLKSEPNATSGRYLLEAAYALPKVSGVNKDTLLVSEIKLVASSLSDYEPANADAWGPAAPFLNFESSVEYLTVVWACSAIDEAMQRTELRSFKISDNDSLRFPDLTAVWDLPAADRASLLHYLGVVNPQIHKIPITGLSTAAGEIVNGVSPGPLGWSLLDDDHENVRRYTGRLWSVDLQSMSFFYSYADQRTVASGYNLIAFNKTHVRHDAPVALSPEDQAYIDGLGAGSPANLENEQLPQLPPALFLRLCRYVQPSVMDTAPWTGFSVHPAGHWSHAGPHGVDEEFDIVKPANSKATSHKQLFNTAFGQSREHSYYAEIYPEGMEGGGFSRADIGTFRTSGIWVTF